MVPLAAIVPCRRAAHNDGAVPTTSDGPDRGPSRRAAGLGLEPRIPGPEPGELPITPSRTAVRAVSIEPLRSPFRPTRLRTCVRTMAPPKRIPGETQAAVKRLIEEGLRPAEIASRLGISRPTVTYHVKRLGLEVDLAAGHRHDWSATRAYYDEGHSAAECRAHFGFNRGAWSLAV